ncbi:UPF0481 protein At3g47200-like isoform X2 [Ipomoea triloba]|uniref:UPF0481 protein At3g47200-like isoform X2 n=1 Tax=Ipomoea triloba TaxID=35885 RepID=UPI00125E75C0|nr:UPF0481 protein At3g47200-like isoform X2 [Ipomoea triloba]
MAHHFEADSKTLLLHEQQEKKKEGDCIVDITEEKQKQEPGGKCISRVNSALTKTNEDAYKPKLISIGPYHMKDPGLENGVKQDFQKSVFKTIDGFKEDSTKRLTELKDKARSWYAEDTQHMNDAEFVDMLLLDGCFVLEFLEKLDKGEDDVFMKVSGKVYQTSTDMLLFENRLPFFVLFELYKLKKCGCTSSGSDHRPENDNENDDNAALLLQDLIVLVKKSFGTQVPKLTPRNVVAHEYKAPDVLPKHLIQVVHSLCIPRNAKCPSNVCDSGGMIEQINTATELQDNGIGFMKIGNVYEGYFDDKEGPNFNANDGTTMFDLDFNNGILKIPSFMIQDNTETFLRNMIAYEQHSRDAPMCFTDFACFMDELIESTTDVNLLRRRGIIINWLATDDMVTKMFYNLCQDVIAYNTYSELIKKVNRHGNKAWNIWYGKLRHDLFYSPWKLISTVVGGLVVTLGTAVTLKNLFGY